MYGCTDPDACNYDIALGANVDDGSCYEMGAGNISGSIFPFAGGEFDYAYNGLEGTTLVWSVEGGEIISGQGTAEVRVLWGTEEEFGAVYVSETDNAGCEDKPSEPSAILDVADIAEASHAHATLMPNPAKGRIALDWTGLPNATAQVVIVDMLGAEVLRTTTTTMGWIDIQSCRQVDTR